MHCIEDEKIVILKGSLLDKPGKMGQVFMRGDHGWRQDIRFPVKVVDTGDDFPAVFNFLGTIMDPTVKRAGDEYVFHQTALTPTVVVKGGNVTRDQTVTVTLTLTNG